MSKDEIMKEIGDGKSLIILQKTQLIIAIVIFLASLSIQIGYSMSWKDEVSKKVEILEEKVENLSQIKTDLFYIRESLSEIKEKMAKQDDAVKEFYKQYRLEKK